MNKIFNDDCLNVLKNLLGENNSKPFIDLIYIDPPFNSNRDYYTSDNKKGFSDIWNDIDQIVKYYKWKWGYVKEAMGYKL